MSFLGIWKRHAVVAAAVILWVPAVAYGINVLWKYATTPGLPASPPVAWPVNAPFERGKKHATLLLFAHPQCPCSRASLGELAIIMAHTGGQLDADVFFYLPAREPSAWARTDLWRTANSIPGVRTFEDPRGAVAQRFGAFTSGQTLLYGSAGNLLFNGGITAYRGHSGDNAGRSAITELLQGGLPRPSILPVVTPVFGCSLRGES